jgi:F-type H+-transporting ATPase subunit delta
MKIPKEARKISRELFQASLDEGRLNEGRVRAIANQVVSSKPRYFSHILKEYERLVRLELAKHHAVIESATEMDEAARAEVEATLRKRFGPDVTTEFSVHPELIGGMRIKIGSDVFDSTVRDRLRRLDAALA